MNAVSTTESVAEAKLTADVCRLDFPPARYGHSLPEIESTVQQVVERVFRDEDGILCSSVNALTMKRYRPEDVRNRPDGVGTFAENSAIPRHARQLWINYENAGQASGVYLETLCAKAAATGSQQVIDQARRLFQAIRTLWENGAQTAYPLGGGISKGWFPKPYLGIRNVSQMFECSADQYVEITLGLHRYHDTLATDEEKVVIREIVVSFAEWWYDHDYAGIYFGQAIWWKRLENHSLAVGCFLYLNALANAWKPSQKFQQGFEMWFDLRRGLLPPAGPEWVCMNGIALKCIEKLLVLRPEQNDFWLQAAAHQARILNDSTRERVGFNKSYESRAFSAGYLAAAHRLFPQGGHDALVRQCLEACNGRADYYHLARGEPFENLSSREQGDDVRDAFHCECHVHWLNAYWSDRAFQ